jgi:hypothetical protein
MPTSLSLGGVNNILAHTKTDRSDILSSSRRLACSASLEANAPPVDAAGRGEDGGDGAAEDDCGASGEVTALGDAGRECVALGGNSERALSFARWSFRIVMPNRKIENYAR